jgi:hypothetical protein
MFGADGFVGDPDDDLSVVFGASGFLGYNLNDHVNSEEAQASIQEPSTDQIVNLVA